MFLLVFVVLLGTVVTVNSAQPEVEMFTDIVHLDDVSAENGMAMMLVCRARGFITSDIIVNFKKNGFIQSKGDGVMTSGVKPQGDIYWRRDHVIIPHSEVSHYSCEVVHAASRFRVVKVWDPESDGRGRIISSEFIETTKPEVKMFIENSSEQKSIFLLCEALGFYPHHITVNIRRNGRILTREDGVESSGIRPNGDNTFQIRDGVEIKNSDPSVFSCEVIHDASHFHDEKVWGHNQVEMLTKHDMGMMLVCRARGFITSDITLNIKKKGFILTKEDGVKTTGVEQDKDKSFRREDHVIIPQSEVSNYSCEVVHASSRFRVEKVWDPDSDGKGRIISFKFIDPIPPHVEMFHENSDVEKNVFLFCDALGFYPHHITVNIKRNGTILTKEDGVESSGIRPHGEGTFQRRHRVEIKNSDPSDFSCEVIHDASGSRVEKVLDKPEVKMFVEGSTVEKNVFLLCEALGFYPNNIIMTMKRNGRILTREDGVKSSDVRPNEDGTFQRRDSVEIKKSDKSDFSCEVIHDASGSRVEKFWDHSLPASAGAGESRDKTGIITGAVVGGLLVLLLVLVVVVLVVLRRRGILGAAAERDKIKYSGAPAPQLAAPQPGGDVNIPLMDGTKGSKTSLNSDNSSDSGHGGSQSGDSGSDADSRGSLSGFSTSSDVPASTAPPSSSPDSGVKLKVS